ncbi:MAG: DNA-directed RNA polymerase subunit alpha [Candidatus Aminicenantes bacterium]|nr:DNA-directed RNA polymerase subunit alpha [Candidatus Aminicenantes bacterium]
MSFKYQRPRKLDVEELTPNYGRFSAEPFERGYGMTVGIALRRVLLSLIEGAAITAMRIDGVLHEFSIIPGIYEDVLNIILNIKTVPLKLNSDEPQVVRIQKSGPGEILSGDILGDGSVEVLDKNIHLAYMEEGAKFQAELIVKRGLGFQLSDQNFDETLSVDYIPVDANFNPVEKVNYTISPSRVGKTTDYEKLIIDVWTNGSISPKDALARAGKILRDHLVVFIDYQDKEKLKPGGEPEAGADMESKTEYLEKTVESMGLSVRALKCLKRLGVDYIFELVEKTEHELLNSKNFGKKSLEEIIGKLNEYELGLGQKLPEALRLEFKKKFLKKDTHIEIMEE